MRVLVLAEKRVVAQKYVDALKARGVKANYLRLLKISLVSKHKNTLIKALEENIPKYDAVLLSARLTLTPFIEPLLEELKRKNIYCNARPGSYYIGLNEPYKFVTLAINNVKTPRTLTAGDAKNIERVSKKISYPLTAKSFRGKDVQQSILVNNDTELNSFVNSIRSDIDGFMLREFISDCVVSCVVIGDKVFAVERKQGNKCVLELEKGHSIKLNDEERETVVKAARVVGYDIARVDVVKGYVIAVEPVIPLDAFDSICSESIEDYIASFFIEKINDVGAKRTAVDEIKHISGKLSNTILGRFLK